jgi:hypothetical protein
MDLKLYIPVYFACFINTYQVLYLAGPTMKEDSRANTQDFVDIQKKGQKIKNRWLQNL